MEAVIEVWNIDLAKLPPPSEAALAALDDDERRRHASYLVAESARIFATTRLALRKLIGARTRQPSCAVRLALDAHGKPFAPDHLHLSFNVSHCETTALIAFCDTGPVGVDIENSPRKPAPQPLAAMICTDAELVWLRANPLLADSALGRLWSRKEAVVKAWGTGLAQDVSRIELGNPGQGSGVVEVPDGPRTVWRDLDCPNAQAAAVAATSSEATGIRVRMRSFTETLAGGTNVN